MKLTALQGSWKARGEPEACWGIAAPSSVQWLRAAIGRQASPRLGQQQGRRPTRHPCTWTTPHNPSPTISIPGLSSQVT